MSDNRADYRKNLKVGGTLVSGDKEIAFFTRNVSLNGFQAYSDEADFLQANDMVYVRLPELSLEGVVSVLWTKTENGDMFTFGFKFLNMRGVDGSTYRYREADQDAGEQSP